MSEVKEPEVKRVCFSVEGAFLAEFARTRYEEGAWERAIKMLTDSLEGLTTDQAVQIIKGEKTLTGDSNTGINLRTTKKNDAARKKYETVTNFLYGKIFRYSDKYLEPYANVSGPWNRDDWAFACSDERVGLIIGSGAPAKRPYGRNEDARYERRSMFYADDPAQDMLVIFEADLQHYEILCRRSVKPPPFWLEVSTNEPETFLRKLHAEGKLVETWQFEYRGAYESDPIPEKLNAAPKAEMSSVDSLEDRQAAMSKMVNDALDAITNATSADELAAIDREFEGKINRAKRGDIPDAEWDRIEEARKSLEKNRNEMYRERILEQAKHRGGFIRLELKDKDDKPYSPRFVDVPANPFIRWALRGFDYEDYDKQAPEWDNVVPFGYKMMGDDPDHSDWFIGAGADPQDAYDHNYETFGGVLMKNTYEARNKIVKEWTGVEFSFLARSKKDRYASGKVFHAKRNEPVPPGCIAICEDASVDYHMVLESINKDPNKRGIVICETGGKLAHLATVGREYDVTVLLVPNALKKYHQDELIFVSFEEMIITTHL